MKVLKTSVLIMALSIWALPAQSGMNDAAKNALITLGVGIGANAIAATKFAGKCSSSNGTATIYCVGAITAATQALGYVLQSGDANDSYNASQCPGCSLPDFNVPEYEIPEFGGPGEYRDPGAQEIVDLINEEAEDVERIIRDLEEKGYKYDPKSKKVRTPSGKMIDPKKLATAAGASSQGISDSEFADFQKGVAEANAAANKKAKELQNKLGKLASGGGGGRRGTGDGAVAKDTKFSFKGLFPDKKKKDKGVTGLSKQFGDGLIGVAGDNIFDMVARRYDSKEAAGAIHQNPAARQLRSRLPARTGMKSRWYIKKNKK